MTDHACLLAASFRRSPEDAYSMTFAPGCEADAPGKAGVSRDSAADIMARAALSQPDKRRILAMPYPVEHQLFWQVLADLGVTQEGLMNLMGASP